MQTGAGTSISFNVSWGTSISFNVQQYQRWWGLQEAFLGSRDPRERNPSNKTPSLKKPNLTKLVYSLQAEGWRGLAGPLGMALTHGAGCTSFWFGCEIPKLPKIPGCPVFFALCNA